MDVLSGSGTTKSAVGEEGLGDMAITNEEKLEMAESFPAFMKYVKVNEPGMEGQGTIPWEPWGYLMEMARELPRLRRLVILKARQLGFSWLVASYAVWMSVWYPGSLVLLLSQGEDEARELLGKCKFILDHLPDEIKPRETKRNESELEFGGINSRIKALPSTRAAGAGFTASLVICDEHDLHPYAVENWAVLEPTINAGGQVISVSASYGAGTFFQQLYEGAKNKENGFEWRFYHALLRPGRDEEWYLRTKENFKEAAYLFPSQYPRGDGEAFVVTGGRPVFDLAALERLRKGCREGVRVEEYTFGRLKVWEEPRVGMRYVCGSDVAYGLETPDLGVSQVLNWQTGRHVASLSGHFPPEELAERTVKLCREYGDAFLGMESNGVGKFCLRRVENLGYANPENLFYNDWERIGGAKGEEPRQLGWVTSESSRAVLVAELGEALRTGALLTEDGDTVGELGTFVLMRGRAVAGAGSHDDRVMALGIAWQMRQHSGYTGIASRGGKGGVYVGKMRVLG
mgnify:FL=1